MVTSTVMGPMKPSAVPVSAPPPAEATYSLAVLTALMMAEEVIVAPVTESTSAMVRSPWLSSMEHRKSQSLLALWPRP